MERLILALIVCLLCMLKAHSQKTEQTIIEGGRTLVELIKIFKAPKANLAEINKGKSTDSCVIKQMTNLCFKNSSSRSLVINLYKRSDTSYQKRPFTIKVLSAMEECWY